MKYDRPSLLNKKQEWKRFKKRFLDIQRPVPFLSIICLALHGYNLKASAKKHSPLQHCNNYNICLYYYKLTKQLK